MRKLSKDQRIFTDILTKMLKTFIDKNIDYGSSYKADGVVGVVVRIGDKVHRTKVISKKGYQIRVKGEKLRNTLMDLANYSVIALMLMQKENAKKKGTHSNHKQKFVQQSKNNHPELTRPY